LLAMPMMFRDPGVTADNVEIPLPQPVLVLNIVSAPSK
jgi:hypothetical protein